MIIARPIQLYKLTTLGYNLYILSPELTESHILSVFAIYREPHSMPWGVSFCCRFMEEKVGRRYTQIFADRESVCVCVPCFDSFVRRLNTCLHQEYDG